MADDENDEKKRHPFTKEGIEAFKASLWQPPPLPQRFQDAIPLLAELSGETEQWWQAAMGRGQGLPFWVAHLEAGKRFDDAEFLRAAGTDMLAQFMLAHLGKAPPPELVREFDRRLSTVRAVRNPMDEKFMDDEIAAELWRVWTAIQRVVTAANPEAPKQ